MEAGIPAGTWNKYQSKNLIQNYLVNNFLKTVEKTALTYSRECKSALDIGCGEGMITAILGNMNFASVLGVDFSSQIIEIAQNEHPSLTFKQANVFDLDDSYRSDFVTACEVIEHIDRPEQALEKIASITGKICLLSVPNEPIFRSLNFFAGKYWSRLGSSPGHLNHWSSKSFMRLVENYFTILTCKRPLPWTILVCRPRT